MYGSKWKKSISAIVRFSLLGVKSENLSAVYTTASAAGFHRPSASVQNPTISGIVTA
ncbi:hypothetical protein ACFSQ7_34690 [Paenibacillus rhizoplanae]